MEDSKTNLAATTSLQPIDININNDDKDSCLVCTDSPVNDICHVQPCGHRLGCYICICTGLQTLQKCWLCREPVACIVQERTGRMLTIPTWKTSHKYNLWRIRAGGAREVFTPPSVVTAVERQVLRRIYIYHHRLFSRHVGVNARSGYREITPHVFRNEPSLQHRAKTFLRRELRVFAYISTRLPGETPARVPKDDPATIRLVEDNVLYFMYVLKTVDLKGSSGAAEDAVRRRLGSAISQMEDGHVVANLFIHELRAFLMSPFTRLREWDASVQYDEPARGLASVPRIFNDDANWNHFEQSMRDADCTRAAARRRAGTFNVLSGGMPGRTSAAESRRGWGSL